MPAPSLTISVTVNDVPNNGVVHLRDYRDKPAALVTRDKAPYVFDVPLPAAGEKIPFGVEVRANKSTHLNARYTLAADGVVTPDKPVTDDQPDPATPPVTEQPTTPTTPKLTGKMRLGLCDATRGVPSEMIPLYRPLGITTLAPWIGTRNFNIAEVDDDGDIDSAIAFAAAGGYSIAWRLAQGEHKGQRMTAALAKAKGRQWHKAFAAMARAKCENNPKTAGKRRRYQIGNEPDHANGDYFAEGSAVYARDYLPYCAEGIREADPTAEIIAAGYSYKQGEFEANADQMAKYADALAVHYYPEDVRNTGAILGAAVKSAAARGKTLVVSEANLGYGKKYKKLTGDERAKWLAKWAADVPAYLIAAEAAGVSEAWYFLGWDAGTTASPAHLFGKGLKGIATTPFYDAVRLAVAQ